MVDFIFFIFCFNKMTWICSLFFIFFKHFKKKLFKKLKLTYFTIIINKEDLSKKKTNKMKENQKDM